MKKKYLLISSAVVLALGLAGYVVIQSRQASYDFVRPKQIDLVESIYGLGTVKSLKVFEYKVGVTSHIVDIYVSEGDQVNKGQRLLQLETGAPILAPFAGTVTSLPFHKGENVFASTTLIRVEDLTDRYVEISLEQHGALRVKKEQKVRMSFESFRNQTYEGLIDTIYPFNGQFIVKILTQNLPSAILPGMTVDVAVLIDEKKGTWAIPTRAINNGAVILKREGKRIKLSPQIGLADDEWSEINPEQIKTDDLILVPKKS